MLDIECIWRTASGKQPCRVRCGWPRPWTDGSTLTADFEFAPLGKDPLLIGNETTALKRFLVMSIQDCQRSQNAELTDLHGEPIDLKALLPIQIDEYDGVSRVPAPGHPPATRWMVDVPCRWVSSNETTGFRFRIADEEAFENGDRGYRISAGHPRIGDIVMRSLLRFVLGRPLPDIADWHGARILGKDGKPVDFCALAMETMGFWPEGFPREMIPIARQRYGL